MTKVSDRTRLPVISLVILFVILGAYLRFVAVLETNNIALFTVDGEQYYAYAYNLKFNGVYSKSNPFLNSGSSLQPDAYRPPGYPLFLTLFVDKDHSTQGLLLAKSVQAGLSVIALVILAYLSWVLFGRAASVLVTFFVSINSHTITANQHILTESLFTFLLSVLFLFIFLWYRYPNILRILVCGICLGAIALVKPSAQYFVVVFLIFLALTSHRLNLKMAAGLLLGFVLVVSPWMVRNMQVTGHMADSQVMVNSIVHGSYIDLMYRDDPKTFGYPYKHDPDSDKKIQSVYSALSAIADQFLSAPAATLKWYLVDKAKVMWSWGFIQGGTSTDIMNSTISPYKTNKIFIAADEIARKSYPFLLFGGGLLCIIIWTPNGFFGFSRRALIFARVISLFVLYITAITVLVAPFPRYTMPVRPILFILSMIFWVSLVSKLRQTSRKRALQD